MIFDMHCDILTDITEQYDQGNKERLNEYHLDLYGKGNANMNVLINFIDPFEAGTAETFKHINEVALKLVAENENISVIKTKEQLLNLNPNTQWNSLLGIEGLSEVKNVQEMYDLGYRLLGLTWNEKNDYAAGSIQSGGLTTAGKKLIDEAVELGMIIDLAHLNEQSFWGVVEYLKKPLVVSHSGCRKLCNHVRNLSDEQLRAVAKSDGVVGIPSLSFFLEADSKDVIIDTYIDHIMHAIDVMTVENVAIGFDFCHYLKGEEYNDVKGLEDITCAPLVIELLRERGLTEESIEKIASKNVIRVFSQYLK